MAKKPVVVPPHQQEDELTVTVFRFRGSGESMRKGFEAFGAALGVALGTTPAPAPARVIGNGRKPQTQLTAAPDAAETETPEDETEADGEDEAIETAAETEAPAKTRKPAQPRYSYLPEFNLAPDGVTSLKDYCADKDAETEENRYLLITSWLQKYGGAEPWTGNHLFTCFRELSPWKGRLDIMAPVRELASKKSFFAKAERGQWKLTGTGMRAAEAIGQKAQ